MNSGLIWTLVIRGACSGELLAGVRERLRHPIEDELTRLPGLDEGVLHDLLRDAGDLDVHLERGDAEPGARHLEVHVPEVILRALDVREDHVVGALLDQAHRDARHGPGHPNPGGEQRQRGRAHRPHRRRAVGLERLRDEPDRVGKLGLVRDHGLERPLGELAVADVAPLRAAHEAGLPDRERREVVVVHEPPLLLEREIVDPLALLRGAERQERQDLRLSTREEGRAVCPRRDVDLARDRPDLVRPATVRPALLDRDLLAHEILVDRLGCLLDVLAGERILRRRRGLLAVDRGRRRADRERELNLVDDAGVEEIALGGLQLLRVLLGVGQRPQVALELRAHGLAHALEAQALEDLRQPGLDLHAPADVLLGRAHRHRRRTARPRAPRPPPDPP